MLKKYISITKPGIIFGNLVTVIGGFFLASNNYTDWPVLLLTVSGIMLIIACGCVFNNVIDRDIDRLMDRTKNRVMVHGLISKKQALVYAVILMVLGSVLLYKVNVLTLQVALVGLFFYVVVYTLAFKRRSVYGTLIGSISGAIPPLVGYCAVRNGIDAGAIILFFMLVIWQMPHSYAIAIFRFKDYTAANIPVLPIKKGSLRAKVSILIYTILFLFVSSQLYFWNYAGIYYLITSILVSLWWIVLAIRGFSAKDDVVWARKLFGFSIIIIMSLSFMMAVNVI